MVSKPSPMTNTNLSILNELRLFIDTVHEEKTFIENKNHFTVNDSKLNFQRLISFILNLPKKSVSLEIEEFFRAIGKAELACTKSAFTQQRSKLSFEFFSTLCSKLLDENYFKNKNKLKRWKNFILSAVDGSTMTLINKPDVKNYFGTQINQHIEVPMARIMGIYDVLNNVSIACNLFPISIGEQTIMKQWIEVSSSDHLFLYDRAFPGFTTIFLHHQQEQTIHYVMRTKHGMNEQVRTFANSTLKDTFLYFEADNNHVNELYKLGYKVNKGTLLKVRAIKVKLKGGEVEILLTNLVDRSEYPFKIFKDLYFKRWGIEINYNAQKNYLQIECFSGTKVNSILQDFYASIFIGNLQSIIANSCEKDVAKKTSHRRYKYKINRNLAIGLMKNKIPKLFLDRFPERIIEEIRELQMKFIEPIRLGRINPRNRRSKKISGKYQTELNYKRVI
jgi:Transposase DDE domain